MRMSLLKWHEMQDIPKYGQFLIVIYYKMGIAHYKIATYWESDNLFHEDDSVGLVPRVLKSDMIVAWSYLPLIVEKQPNNEVD